MDATQSEGVYRRSIVIDTTAPLPPLGAVGIATGPEDLVKVYSNAGVTSTVFTLVDDYPNSIEQTLKIISWNRHFFLSRPENYIVIEKADDVREAKAQGKLAVGFAFQGSNALLGELRLVEVYRKLGVIQMLLAYNAGNLAADGCHESRNAGLSQFGRDLVAEMNRVGMVVDATHVGLKSSLELLEVTVKPAIFSHSTPQKFAAHDRNITDEQIRACAATGGVVGLTGLGLFMDGRQGKASVSQFADTVEYVIQIVGARHAAIGLDYVADPKSLIQYLQTNSGLYGGGAQYPEKALMEFLPPSALQEVCSELLRRRYSEGDIVGVLGENYLRVLDENL